ncbi:MAG TPA: hypothetical protein VE959_20105 [Bryobacteraceae bacterium]|nr:hypothetical protein [Bryobacteraceae bacterium]
MLAPGCAGSVSTVDKTTVEAPSAEAAEQMVFDKAADSAGEVEVTAVPTKEWNVSIELMPFLTFTVIVKAESAADAESKAYEAVENEAYDGDGIPGVLDLAEYHDLDMGRLDINAYDATPIEDEEEEDSEPAQPDTATEDSAA